MKFLLIVLFPLLWVAMYLYRIIWVVMVGTITKIITNLMIMFSRSFLAGLISVLWLIVTFPFVLVYEIIVGIFATFIGTVRLCASLWDADGSQFWNEIRASFGASR